MAALGANVRIAGHNSPVHRVKIDPGVFPFAGRGGGDDQLAPDPMRGKIVGHAGICRDSAHGPGKGVPEIAVRGLIEIETQPVVGQQTDVAAGR